MGETFSGNIRKPTFEILKAEKGIYVHLVLLIKVWWHFDPNLFYSKLRFLIFMSRSEKKWYFLLPFALQ